MRNAFNSCRLYSWMRLIWQSKIVSGSTVSSQLVLSQSTKRSLACALASRKALAKGTVVGERVAAFSIRRDRSPNASPIASVIVPAQARGWPAAASGAG